MTSFPNKEAELQEVGFIKDKQSITADWSAHGLQLIEGVVVREVKHVLKNNGHVTELYRRDWELDDQSVDQVFQVVLQPAGLSAWHIHETTTDRLFVSVGTVKIVLCDLRPQSPTFGLLNEFRVGELRPQLIVVPSQVAHGVQNIGHDKAVLLNLVDRAYQYEDPDHWRISYPSSRIPYQF